MEKRGLRPFEERSLARRERARARLEQVRRRGGVVASSGVAQPHRSRRVATALFVLAVAAGSFVAAQYKDGSERVSQVAVIGHERIAAHAVALATGVTPGLPLSRVDTEAVRSALLAHPWIREASATTLRSGELLVRIEERVPAALVSWPGAARGWLVDADGNVFAHAEAEHVHLPRLRAPAPLAARDAASEDAGTALLARGMALATRAPGALAHRALEWRLPLTDSPEGWVLHASDEPALTIVLGHEELEARLDRLSLLLASGRPEIDDAREIDLRFAEQAVLRGLAGIGGDEPVLERSIASQGSPSGSG